MKSLKHWLQKFLVLSVALLTFGLITPNHSIWESLENRHNSVTSERSINTDFEGLEISQGQDEWEDVTHKTESDDPTYWIMEAAKEQSYIKFGTKIAPIIGDEFEQRIYPQLQSVVMDTLAKVDEETKQYLTISDRPSGNYSEKIFHLVNGQTGEDILRFHVRTEKRPLEGYFYNFHYHTFEDQFATHHTIGEIYWSKDTPPKWLS